MTKLGASDPEDGNVPCDSNCTWFQWKTVKEERIIRGKTTMISFTVVKATVSGTVNSLLTEATKLVHAMKCHTYNITHQALSTGNCGRRWMRMNVSYTLTSPKITPVNLGKRYRACTLEPQRDRLLCTRAFNT